MGRERRKRWHTPPPPKDEATKNVAHHVGVKTPHLSKKGCGGGVGGRGRVGKGGEGETPPRGWPIEQEGNDCQQKDALFQRAVHWKRRERLVPRKAGTERGLGCQGGGAWDSFCAERAYKDAGRTKQMGAREKGEMFVSDEKRGFFFFKNL